MKAPLLDANVVVRFFVERRDDPSAEFRGVFSFFEKVTAGQVLVEMPDIVLLEIFYVLTRIYGEPGHEVAESLLVFLSFDGIVMADKDLASECLKLLQKHKIGFADAYLLALSKKRNLHEIYSYDADLKRRGLRLLKIE